MLSVTHGKKAVDFSRLIITKTLNSEEMPKNNDLPDIFNERRGVFTTLHTYPANHLRGCIGIPEPIMKLKKALIESGQSVIHDPRFPSLQIEELDHIIIEITILSKPQVIMGNDQEIIKSINIGREGLIVEQGFYKGLLLPQVAVEQNWDTKTFLEHTCLKASLPKDAWLEKNTIIKKFTGQIFSEKKPNGNIWEKTFDES